MWLLLLLVQFAQASDKCVSSVALDVVSLYQLMCSD